MHVSVFEIGGYQILNMISVCQQTCAELPITRSYEKSVPSRLELPKTNEHRKTPEGVITARVSEKCLLKIPNILHY